jgi:hypothetical protein
MVPVLTWTDLVEMASSLPGVEESTSYRTPAHKVAGKLIPRHRTDADSSVMVSCELDEKEALVASVAAGTGQAAQATRTDLTGRCTCVPDRLPKGGSVVGVEVGERLVEQVRRHLARERERTAGPFR